MHAKDMQVDVIHIRRCITTANHRLTENQQSDYMRMVQL